MKRVSYIAVCVLLSFMGIYLVSARMNNRTHNSSVNQEQPWQIQTSVQSDQVAESGMDVSRKAQVTKESEPSSGANNKPLIQDRQSQAQISAQNDQFMKPEMDNSRHEQLKGESELAVSRNSQQELDKPAQSLASAQGDQVVEPGIDNSPNELVVGGRQLARPESSLPIQQPQGPIQATAVNDKPVPPAIDMSPKEQAASVPPVPVAQNNSAPIPEGLQTQEPVLVAGVPIIRPRAGISWKEIVMKQREISNRALAKRYALTIQAANDGQNENQNGILDEIQNVMQ
jgi:hypothetical protein